MSDETTSTTPPKKSRSTSDAERRRARRAQKILSSADSRLHRITATYSLSANASPVTSKKSSPQQSQKSSPTTSEAPDSPFSTRRNTGNLEPLPESLLPITESLPPSTDISGSSPFSSSSTLLGEDNNTIQPDEDYFRRVLENFRTKNSSNTSIASTSTSEYQYYSSPGGLSPFLTPEDLAPLFWYFITIELILQSSRLFLQKEKSFQGSVLGNLAARLPSPFSDVLVVFLRYNLIWKCLLEDACVLVFIIGSTIMISPIISYLFH
ncbi:5754_t:CDS:2 [Diversispora eburnea]|uniref:5754_t:CDS:1 n=1 Tax=Diversispora eburnea TaxID=1213867 RepID=A0A9N8YKV7_9GLOM|nr:5754_t:CDS:2 [Diversispora eburnea]